MEIVKTEKDYIKDIIQKAKQFYFDGKNPSNADVEKLENELYDNLFGYRDSKKELPQISALQNLINEFRDHNYEWEKFMRKEVIRTPKSIDEFINEVNKKYVVGYNSLG